MNNEFNAGHMELLINNLSVANRRDGWVGATPQYQRADLERAKKAVDDAERKLLDYVRSIAAPERSGESADVIQFQAHLAGAGWVEILEDQLPVCHSRGVQVRKLNCYIDRIALAAHSSAAPSGAKRTRGNLVERLYNEPPDYGILVEAGAEIQRLRAELNAALAAPAPTGEILSAAILDGLQQYKQTGAQIQIDYASPAKAESAWNAITDAIDTPTGASK